MICFNCKYYGWTCTEPTCIFYKGKGKTEEQFTGILPIKEIDELKGKITRREAYIKEWTDAALRYYPQGWAFDGGCPIQVISNIVRAAEDRGRREGYIAGIQRALDEFLKPNSYAVDVYRSIKKLLEQD